MALDGNKRQGETSFLPQLFPVQSAGRFLAPRAVIEVNQVGGPAPVGIDKKRVERKPRVVSRITIAENIRACCLGLNLIFIRLAWRSEFHGFLATV